MLNKVFEQAEGFGQVGPCETNPGKPGTDDGLITDVEVRDLTPANQPPVSLAAETTHKPAWGSITATGAAVTGVAATGLLGMQLLLNQQQALQQERNLVLLGQLRRSQDPTAGPTGSGPTHGGPQAELLPPAPPTEPWMEELAKLPPTGAGDNNLLKVPLHGPLATASLPSPATGSSPGGSLSSLPQLVGIIQGAGKSGSAIFQTGGSSTSVAAGEAIGASGWRLRATTGETAIIERGGEQRRLSMAVN